MSTSSLISRIVMKRGVLIGLVLGWYFVFFLVPFLLVLKISLSPQADTMPPYGPLASFDGARLSVSITFENFARLISDPIFVGAYLGSLQVAAVTTVFCILFGYPLAYAVAVARPANRPILLLMLTIPFWTSFLIRIYAWIGLLKDNGLINNALISLGLIDEPFHVMNTSVSVTIGMVYCYLPFFILPLYAVLEKLDWSLIEAAKDLGCRPLPAFGLITLPLSLPGVAAGALLVFVPATGEYLIPKLLGGSVNLMAAPVLWDSFFVARNWPIAAAATVALVVILLLPLALIGRTRSAAVERAS